MNLNRADKRYISKLRISQNSMYKRIFKQWFEYAMHVHENLIFCKFFSLWCSFNSLYNLVGDYETPDNERIEALTKRLNQEDADFIISSTKSHFDFFMLKRQSPIRDMQKDLFRKLQPDDVKNFEPIKQRYLNPHVENLKKIKYIMPILYRVRNNLTHGSKSPGGGMDETVIRNAVPILQSLVQVIAVRVFEMSI